MAQVQLLELGVNFGTGVVSYSSNTPGLGRKVFAMANMAALPMLGQVVRATAKTGQWLEGVVTQAPSLGALEVDVLAFSGSGTGVEWTFAWEPLRFSTAPYATGPGETPASRPYDARILQAGDIGRYMFDRGTTGGASRLEIGDIVLANGDGALDRMLDMGLDGQPVRLLLGQTDAEGRRPLYPSGFTLLLAGTMAAPSGSLSELRLSLRSRQAILDQPLQPLFFAGNNNLPSGLEGTASDIKGQVKPLVLGGASNVAPPLVNTSLLIYQVNTARITDLPAVYDNGVPLTRGPDYTQNTQLGAQAPAAGTYRLWVQDDGAWFRVGSQPAGTITCDVQEGPNAPYRSVIVIMVKLAAARGLMLNEAELVALLGGPLPEAEFWLDDPGMTVAQAMDRLCSSIGVYWGFDASGTFRMGRLEPPSGTPKATFRRAGRGTVLAVGDIDIHELELYAAGDQPGGLPVARVSATYGPNWTVQTDVAGSVAAGRRAWLAQARRQTSPRVNTATQSLHPLAGDMVLDTLLKFEADADAEAARQLAMRSTRRDRVVLSYKLEPQLPVVDVGDVVRVVLPRFGYNSGRDFRVTGARLDAAARLATLELWG